MTGINFNSKPTTDTTSVPPIVLCNSAPKQFVCVPQAPDKFDKNENSEQKAIMIDPNDKFVRKVDNNEEDIKSFAKPKLGAKFDPKKAKQAGKEVLNWGKRVWAGLEIYDTIDGYRERMKNNSSEN